MRRRALGSRARSHRPSLSSSPSTPSTPCPPPPSAPGGFVPWLRASWPTAIPLDHSGRESPQKRLSQEIFFYLHSSCRGHLGRSDGRGLGVARGPGASPIFFSAARPWGFWRRLRRRADPCATPAAAVAHVKLYKSEAARISRPSLCVCVCVCVSVRACVCARVCSRLPSHTNAGPRTQFSLSMATVTHSFGDRPTPERAAPAKREQPWLRGSRPGRKREPPRPRGSGPG